MANNMVIHKKHFLSFFNSNPDPNVTSIQLNLGSIRMDREERVRKCATKMQVDYPQVNHDASDSSYNDRETTVKEMTRNIARCTKLMRTLDDKGVYLRSIDLTHRATTIHVGSLFEIACFQPSIKELGIEFCSYWLPSKPTLQRLMTFLLDKDCKIEVLKVKGYGSFRDINKYGFVEAFNYQRRSSRNLKHLVLGVRKSLSEDVGYSPDVESILNLSLVKRAETQLWNSKIWKSLSTMHRISIGGFCPKLLKSIVISFMSLS